VRDGVTGRPSIKIDLANQRAYFYKGQQIVGVSVVSTGREGYNTPSGQFNVTQKDVDHISSLYGDYVDPNGGVVVQNVENGKDPKPPGTAFRGAPMPYFLRIQGGTGLHAGYLPGYPASHGCVRLPEGMALKFFEGRFSRHSGRDSLVIAQPASVSGWTSHSPLNAQRETVWGPLRIRSI